MPTAAMVEYDQATPEVRAVYDDILAVKGIDFVPNFWKTLASHPPLLARVWRGLTEGGAVERTLSEHRAIAEAIAQHDPALATSLATAHIAGVERWLRQAASA